MAPELPPNRIKEAIDPPKETDTLNPEPEPLFFKDDICLKTLKKLSHRSIVEVSDFTAQEVIELCRFAALLEKVEVSPYKPLDGRIVITAFFEASTRTRTSFESAVLRLDGKIISIPDGQVTGAKKGESLEDIGEMFNAYGDLVIMRHTETNAPKKLLSNLRVPLINAGNGTGEHPTQALADWYALLKWRPQLIKKSASKKLHIGILGTPGSMRAVKSFLIMSLFFKQHISEITIVSEMADPFGDDLQEKLEKANISYGVTNNFQDALPKFDVIYMNSIAYLGDSYKTLDSDFKLNNKSNVKKDAVILHPLARRDELDTSLDNTSHNLYWSQAHGAVFIRQALLISLLDRFNGIPREFPLK